MPDRWPPARRCSASPIARKIWPAQPAKRLTAWRNCRNSFRISGANGPDIAAVYQLLTQVARTVTGHDRKLDDLSAEVVGLRGVVVGLRGVVAGLSEIVAGHDRKLDDLAAGLASLRDAVTHYHSSVLGHGMLISELDERVRRIERHLKLEPAGG